VLTIRFTEGISLAQGVISNQFTSLREAEERGLIIDRPRFRALPLVAVAVDSAKNPPTSVAQ